MTAGILSAVNVHLSYENKEVIKGITFSVGKGEFVGIVGPNGSGKTTLLSALSGQFRPSKGNIFYNDRNIYQDNKSYKEKTGVVREDPFLYPYLSVMDHLRFIALVRGFRHTDIDPRILSVLQTVRLSGMREEMISDLSMGMAPSSKA